MKVSDHFKNENMGADAGTSQRGPYFDTLYIGCAPEGELVVNFSKFVQPLVDEISPETHYRLTEEGGFGKGAHILAERVAQELPKLDPSVSIVCSKYITEHKDCHHVLESFCRRVVRVI